MNTWKEISNDKWKDKKIILSYKTTKLLTMIKNGELETGNVNKENIQMSKYND